jgi:hypothetical protein
MIDAESSLIDVAFAVGTALDAAGIIAVLTGGSAANFYAPQKYRSYDVDFVIQLESHNSSGKVVLESIGFAPQGELYAHPRTPFTLEFPPGPLGVGEDIVTSWETVKRADEILHVISRTDSVRDRLAAYYHWNDTASLFTAVDVAQTGTIDFDLVEKWSRRERNAEKYGRFLAQLGKKHGDAT